MVSQVEDLLKKLPQGDPLATSRLISWVERDGAEREVIAQALRGKWGSIPYVGVTGPPGVGKSTLVDQLISLYRKEGKEVGVVAVDPTSPYSGGAILGDRIRMGKHAGDVGVFIRSMGSRGQRGGISFYVRDACRILEASGKDVVFVETVGVGQIEVDIARACDTTLLCLMPQTGDSVQTLKAGILEVADGVVINKKKMGGAERLRQELRVILHPKGAWPIPILLVEATEGEGVAEVKAKIEEHFAHLQESGERRERLKANLLEEVRTMAKQVIERVMETDFPLEQELGEKLLQGEWTPRQGAEFLLEKVAKGKGLSLSHPSKGVVR